ncbi:XRE family transcriptional regulator [Micromonospora gifhornensis]|uniref:XRE family transcriptional regulator n=1 Tax=Micromonospora gifhornensis TaxID=84594 RepID=UPI003650714E
MRNDRLREAMLNRGVTLPVLAEHVGVDPKTVERWVTQGRIPYPRYRRPIARLLKQNETYLWPDAATAKRKTDLAKSELITVYPRRSAVPNDLWRDFVDQATERVDILVYAGLFLVEQDRRFTDKLRAKAEDGVQVRVLLGDPASPEIERRSTDESVAGVMASKIRQVMDRYAEVRDVPNVAVRFHCTTLYNSVYRFDDQMLVNTHVYGLPAPHAPVLHLQQLSGGEFFETYADSFDRVWQTATAEWPAAVAR